MPYRPNYRDSNGNLVDLPIEAETAVKLKTARTIGLSGVTATAKSFNGTGNITIPITSIPGSLLTGTVSTDTTGNAATATKLKTARKIGLSGVTATPQNFDGSSNITIPVSAVPSNLINGSIDASKIALTPNAALGNATNLQDALTYIAGVFTGDNKLAKLSTVLLNLVDSASPTPSNPVIFRLEPRCTDDESLVTCSPSVLEFTAVGQSKTFTATPKSGYQIDDWMYVAPITVSRSGNTFTVTLTNDYDGYDYCYLNFIMYEV
ncbi:MAG: hypothetical protein IJQ23_03615 [Clostridia bacterium]|nr:hypothetical protein [Clostridia bacterium]